MDQQKEYHDPDYPTTSGHIKQEPKTLNDAEKSQKIQTIIRREFSQELEAREGEVMLIDQRMATSRRLLHRLRYTLVSGYYQEQKLLLTPAHIADEVSAQSEPRARSEVSSILHDGQRRLHPSVRKLLGKKTADLEEILFTSRAPRSNARKDYCAMLQSRNYTIAADSTKSLRPSHMPSEPDPEDKPRRMPRVLQPKVAKVLTLDEATRNQMKHRYRIIIGNTSKYAPGASRADRSTHKWLLYVRGGGEADVTTGGVVTAVTVRLHHSYAPHHTVHLTKPPFHVSRRGWGEFPAKLEVHFAMPERNKPATVEHTIKLDRNFTGLQTLGAETIVDVWLYSTPEMLHYEYKEPVETDWNLTQQLVKTDDSALTDPVIPKTEPMDMENMEIDSLDTIEMSNVMSNENVNGQSENWLDFFSNTTELDVDEMFIKPTKKIEQKSDIETVIEANVIKKECQNQIQIQNENQIENHVNEKLDMYTQSQIENDTSVNVNVDLSKVKSEVQDTLEYVTNVKSHTKVIDDLPNELLAQPNSPKKRIMKYMDPTTGKIYYLEMDRNLDLSKVQEIVINSKGNVKTAKISPIKPNGLKNVRKNTKKGGVSLLKPEVKNSLKREETFKEKPVFQKPVTVPQNLKKEFTHIDNDHCYLGCNFNFQQKDFPNTESENRTNIVTNSEKTEEFEIKIEKSLYETLCSAITRMFSVRVAVNYLLKKIPLISGEARDPDFVKNFPFVVENEERYWKLDFAKRRNIEWTRAKLINKMLLEHFPNANEQIWRTKQILIFSRLHGYYPIRTETIQRQIHDQNNFYSWADMDNTQTVQSNIKEIFPNADDICSLSKFDSDIYQKEKNTSDLVDLGDSDEEIDIVKCEIKREIKREVLPDTTSDLQVLPVGNDDDRLRFMFVERKCADIGIELRNEGVGNGYSYSAVHAVLLSAMKNFAEELVRGSLADKLQKDRSALALPPVWTGSSSWRAPISLEHVLAATRRSRAAVLSATNLGTEKKDHYAI